MGTWNWSKCLLENGPDPNDYSSYGVTPMLFAALYGYTSILRTLLDHGAKTNGFGNYFVTQPIYLAAIRGHTEAVQLLLARGVLPPDGQACIDAALQCATFNDSENLVAQLLTLGADPETKPVLGDNAISNIEGE